MRSGEYMQIGLPDPLQSWSLVEFRQATEVLEKLGKKKTQQLPRCESDLSGPVFARLTSDSNLDEFRKRDVPLNQRLEQLLEFGNCLQRVKSLYARARRLNFVSERDTVEMSAAYTRFLAVELELLDELLPTLDPAADDYLQKMLGLESIKLGLAQMLTDFVSSIDRRELSSAEQKRLIGYVLPHFPKLLRYTSGSMRQAVISRLKLLGKDPQYADLEPELGKLVTIARDRVN